MIPDLDSDHEHDCNLEKISDADSKMMSNAVPLTDDKSQKDDERKLWIEPITELLINHGYLIGKIIRNFQKIVDII